MTDNPARDSADDKHLPDPSSSSSESTERRLSRLDDYEVDDGYPDIRGWPVRGSNGLELGIVSELLVDTEHLEVAAVDVQLGVGAAGVRGNVVAFTRIPIESVRVRPDRYVVVDVEMIPCEDVIDVIDAAGEGSDVTRRRVPCGQIGIRKRASRDVEVPRTRVAGDTAGETK